MFQDSPVSPIAASTVLVLHIKSGHGGMLMLSANTNPSGALLGSAAYAVGRGASRVGPAIGGVAVAVLWAAAHGWANLRKYRKGKISKKEAAHKTAAESIGIGLATAVGLMAVNVVRASAFAATSAALVPFLVGTAVTGAAKAAWERKVAKRSPDR